MIFCLIGLYETGSRQKIDDYLYKFVLFLNIFNNI